MLPVREAATELTAATVAIEASIPKAIVPAASFDVFVMPPDVETLEGNQRDDTLEPII